MNANSKMSYASETVRQPLGRSVSDSTVWFDSPSMESPSVSSKEAQLRPTLTRAVTVGNPYNLATIPIPPLDPSPHDPSATFIRWPFTQPLKWSHFEQNPNWFLDSSDFSFEGAPLYPTDLEPPRGWGPPKPKRGQPSSGIDKDKGENRLRCTFCRRTYGGVNAKSMWRRHVYDKHRVAMRNRRDGTQRQKNGDKENITADVPGQKNVIQWVDGTQLRKSGKQRQPTEASVSDQSSLSVPPPYIEDAERHPRLMQRPFTPPPALLPPKEITSLHLVSDLSHDFEPCNLQSSPYDPTRTPQFIHSRPTEPLENALRYPNTSRTLCELTLSPLKERSSKARHPFRPVLSPVVPIMARSSAAPSSSVWGDPSDVFDFPELDTPVASAEAVDDALLANTSLNQINLAETVDNDDFDHILGQFFHLEDTSHPAELWAREENTRTASPDKARIAQRVYDVSKTPPLSQFAKGGTNPTRQTDYGVILEAPMSKRRRISTY